MIRANAGDTLYFDVDAPAPSAPVDPMEEEEARRRRLTDHVGDADPLAEAEEHSGIVGYLEDGLVIYADRTREQKQEDAVEEDREEDKNGFAGDDKDVLGEEEFECIQGGAQQRKSRRRRKPLSP